MVFSPRVRCFWMPRMRASMQYEVTVRGPIPSDIVKRVSQAHVAAILRRAELKAAVPAGAQKKTIPQPGA